MTRVMGVDLSLQSTGIALVESGRLIDVDRIRSIGKKGDDLFRRATRLASIQKRVSDIAREFGPALVVIEAPSYGSTMGAQHDRSGLWWLVVDALFDVHFPVGTVSPNGRAKYGTGKGNAQKDVVMAEVVRRYSRDDLVISGNDEADAVILAAMGSRYLGDPIEASLPLTHLAAMDGAYFPAAVFVA